MLFKFNQIIEVSSLEELLQNLVFPILFIVDVYASGLQMENLNVCSSSLNAVRDRNPNNINEDESRQLNTHNEPPEPSRNNLKSEGKKLKQNYNKLNI